MQFVFHLLLDVDIFIKLKLKRRAIDMINALKDFKNYVH